MTDRKKYMREYYLKNKPLFYARRRAHQQSKPEMYNNKELVFERHKRRLAKKFQVTLETIEELYLVPACQICEDDLTEDNGRNIDHCHKTMKIRGVLCGRCNKALGHMKDDPARLLRAARYLGYEFD